MLIAAVKCGDQVFAPVFAPGDGAAQLSRQPNQENVFGSAATSSGRSRRRRRARRRADRIPQIATHRQWPCGSGAASAWCRSASGGPTPGRTPHGPRALRAASRSGGGSGLRRGRTCVPRAIVASKSAVLKRPSTTTLEGQLSCTRGAPGLSASCASTTDGKSVISITTASAMSSASAGDDATTAAIGSPAKRTTSAAKIGCSIGW